MFEEFVCELGMLNVRRRISQWYSFEGSRTANKFATNFLREGQPEFEYSGAVSHSQYRILCLM
jgi:hypothetical protein